MKKLTIIFALLISYMSYSQSISLFDIDTTNFPIMKAKFYAFDANGNQITNLSPSDFELIENGQVRTVTNVSCPVPKSPKALSCVLTLDVSGSMFGENLRIIQKAATLWINSLPLGNSECAITSFNHLNYLNQDFTTNKTKLLNAINGLQGGGGTNFDEGLINKMAGSLLISKTGKHKKVILLLTDGESFEPQVSKIIAEANTQNCVIYSLILGMNCTQSLKIISSNTGGNWYDNIDTYEEFVKVYQEILQKAQEVDPCEITWNSGASCLAGMTFVKLKILPEITTTTTNYQSPNSSIAKLEINPAYLTFKNPSLGVKVEHIVTVTARNSDFIITNIKSSNPEFEITPSNFQLKKGDSIDLTISYIPIDSGYVFEKFVFENDICETQLPVIATWNGKNASKRTIKLIHPNGGEVFVAGSDTVITWDGILPDEQVIIEYRSDDNQPWIRIADFAVGLSYRLKIPKIASNKYLARVIAKRLVDSNALEMVLIPSGTFKMGNTGKSVPLSDIELPIHNVTISKQFLISKYEITQKQFYEVTGRNPSKFKGDKLPVEQVNFFDAIEFCNKLSELEGLNKCYNDDIYNLVCDWDANGYRLPTEAEWEYACKAGTATDIYNGNLTTIKSCNPLDDILDEVAFYCGNSGSGTHEVGKKIPNYYGLFDMSGNVWEWCWDFFDLYTGDETVDPKGPTFGSEDNKRIIRGGSWGGFPLDCRSSKRNLKDPTFTEIGGGFRVVRNF